MQMQLHIVCAHVYMNVCVRIECFQVCCSVLQCAEVCCSALQCVAVCCIQLTTCANAIAYHLLTCVYKYICTCKRLHYIFTHVGMITYHIYTHTFL